MSTFAQDGRRKKCRTTIPDLSAPPLPDLVKRDFSLGAPGVRSCGDITYVPTAEGWLYVADVEDIGSRRILGFALADHMRTELVASAMDMAVETRGGDVAGMIFHHDYAEVRVKPKNRPIGLCLRFVRLIPRLNGSLLSQTVEDLECVIAELFARHGCDRGGGRVDGLSHHVQGREGVERCGGRGVLVAEEAHDDG